MAGIHRIKGGGGKRGTARLRGRGERDWVGIMVVDFEKIPAREAYQWMIAAITPRPIAWVSTVSAAGVANLAPFSFFSGVTSNPPTLMFVPVNNRDGRAKDTVRNIEETREMVVNVVSADLAAAMSATAAALPPEESEFAYAGLAATPSLRVKPPRVAEARVAFECTLHSIVKIGEGAGAANVVFGLIQCAHVVEAVLDAAGKIDAAKLDAVGRMGGNDYCYTRERFELERG